MGLVDKMGALTDYHKRLRGFFPLSTPAKSHVERRTGTGLVCQRFESQDEDNCTPRKRARTLIGSPEKHQHQHRLQFSGDIFPPLPWDALGNSTDLISRSSKPPEDYQSALIFRPNSVSTLDLIPPPRPLSRTLQGPQRPWMGSSSEGCCDRVSSGEGVSESEEDFSAAARCRYEKRFEMARADLADSVDFIALEQYRKRVADLQQRFAASAPRRNGGNDSGDVEDGANNNNKGRSCEKGSQREYPGSAGTSSSSAVVALGGLDFPNRNINSGKEVEIAAGEGGKIKTPWNERPLYLDLRQKACERDITLKAIDLELQLTTTKLEALQLIKKERFQNEKEKETENKKLFSDNELLQKKEREAAKEKSAAVQCAFAPLTDDEEADVSRALHGQNRREVLVMHENSNIEITREILQCLLPSTWLNDEVINLYLELLKEREKREPEKFLKCHFFNTFFYKKLFNPKNNYDYKAVRRWTTHKKIGYSLVNCEKIFVPIHKEIHWCLAIIDMRRKKFQYLDSLKGTDARVLKVLARYITDEVKDKTGKDLDVSTWEQEYVEDLPEQENGWDCGMFMIKYADFHSQDLPLNFCQIIHNVDKHTDHCSSFWSSQKYPGTSILSALLCSMPNMNGFKMDLECSMIRAALGSSFTLMCFGEEANLKMLNSDSQGQNTL